MTKKRINQLTREAMRQEISYEAKLFRKNILLMKIAIAFCILNLILCAVIVGISRNRQKMLSPNGIYLEKLEEARMKGQIK